MKRYILSALAFGSLVQSSFALQWTNKPSIVQSGQTYNVGASHSHSGSGMTSGNIVIYKNGAVFMGGGNGGYSYTISASASTSDTSTSGDVVINYTATATITPQSGGSPTTSNISGTVIVQGPPNAAPTVAWHTLPTTMHPGTWYAARATGSDSDGNLGGVWVDYRVNGGSWQALAYDVAGVNGGNGSSTTTNNNGVTAGAAGTTYQFRCYAWDHGGANSGWVQSNVVTVTKASQSSITLNASTTQVYGAAQTLSTSGGSGSGAVSYAIVGQSAAGVASLSGATLTANTGSGWVDVQATKASDSTYNSKTSNTVRVTFAKATQAAISVSASSTQTCNTTQTLGCSGGSGGGAVGYVITSSSASGVASLSGATLTANSGTGWVDVQVTKAADNNYNARTSAVFRVNLAKATQAALTFSPTTTLVYNASQVLSATGGSGSGVMSYAIVAQSASGAATLTGATLKANTSTGWVDVQATRAGDTNYNPRSSSTVRITLAKAEQAALTFSPTTTLVHNTSQTLTASGGSGGGAISYAIVAQSASGAATLTGATLKANTGAGWVDVQATRAGDTNYNPKSSSTVRITFAKAEQAALTFSPTTIQVYDTSQTLSATGGSGSGAISYAIVGQSASGAATLTGATLKANTGTGWVDVQATRAGDTNYNPRSSSAVRITFAKAEQAALTFSAATTQVYNTSQVLSATGGSGSGAMSYAIVAQSASGVATLTGATLKANTGTGWVDVHATRAGDTNYNARSSSTVRITFAKAEQAVLSFSPATNQAHGASQTLSASGGSGGGAISYAITGQSSQGVATLSGASLTANAGAGWVEVRATRAGDSNYNAQTSAVVRVNLATAAQVITFGSIADKIYGDAPFELNAAASSGLVVTFSVTGPASVSGKTLTITGAGSVTVTASQAGNSNWGAAANVSRTFIVTPKPATFSFSNVSFIFDGALKSPTINNPQGATYTILGTASATSAGSYSFVVTATGNYTGSGSCSWSIGKANQTITFTNPGGRTYGQIPFALSASSNSGLPVTFSVVSGPASVTGSTVSITGAGGVTLRASQAGDGNRNPASKDVTFSVAKAPLTITAGNKSKVFGQANPTFTATYTGFVNGDTTAVVSGSPTFSTNATPSSVPGQSYWIRPAQGTLSAPNYEVGTFIDGTLSITKAVPVGTFVGRAVSAPYTLQASDLAAAFSHASNSTVQQPGGTISYSIVSATGEGAAPASGTVSAGTVLQTGIYRIRASIAEDACYAPATVEADFVVTRNDPPTLTMQILDESGAALASRESVYGKESGATSAVLYFGQSWKLALTATDVDENVNTLLLRLSRPGGGQGTNPAAPTFVWSSGHYAANIVLTPARSISWVSPTMIADQVGTWNLWAHANDTAAVAHGSVSPWTGDDHGWQTLNQPDLIVAKATPRAEFPDRVFPVASGQSYTLQAADLNAVFTNPYSSTVAGPVAGATVSYSLVAADGTTTPISAGSTLAPGAHTIRASYSGNGNYEATSVEARFAIGYEFLDSDGDGMPDYWEDQYGLNKNVNDAAGNSDGDNATNLEEYHAWRNPYGADNPHEGASGAAAHLTAFAKGNGTLILTAGDDTYSFAFNAAPGNTWSKAIGDGAGSQTSYPSYSISVPYGVTRTFQVSASAGISDFFIKIDQSRAVQRPVIVEIDGKLQGGVRKQEIQGSQFTARARSTGQIPFATMNDSRLAVTRTLEFGFGGGRSGRSAGWIELSFGTWRRGVQPAWRLSVAKGEMIEGFAESATRFQAKVPAGYVDLSRERHRISIRYYRDQAPFSGTFRDFTGVTPVAEYVIEQGRSGANGPTPVPTRILNSQAQPHSWWLEGTARYTITRTIDGVSHLYEHETHWLKVEKDGQNEGYEGPYYVKRWVNHYAAVSRMWPWRAPSAPRGGFVRAEVTTTDTVREVAGSQSVTRNPLQLDMTGYLGNTEASGIADYSYYNSHAYDFRLENAIPVERGLGTDKHELARRRAGLSTNGVVGGQSPTIYDNALGGGTFTEYFTLSTMLNGGDNLDGQPHIAVGEPKYVRQNFLDNALQSSSDLVSAYSYNSELIDGLPKPSLVVTKQGEVEVGRTVFGYSTGTLNGLPTLTTVETKSAGGGVTLATTSRVYSRRIGDPDMRGRTLSVTRPDGSKTSFVYQRGILSGGTWTGSPDGEHFLVAEMTGKTGNGVSSYGGVAIDPLDLDPFRSTATEKIFDAVGRVVREASYVYQGSAGFALLQVVYSGYDDLGRLLVKADQPIATSGPQPGRIFYEAAYSGPQKQWERDEQGITTTYHYDVYNRVDVSKRLGVSAGGHTIAEVTSRYDYDGLGRLIKETKTALGEADHLVTHYTYDTAGRPKTTTAPGGLVTAINYDSATQKTTIHPGGGTTIEAVYKDGRAKAVSGTAVPDSSSTYSYEPNGYLKTTQTTAGQTSVTLADWLGRTLSVSTPTYSGGTRVVSNTYNTVGQLVRQETKVGGSEIAPARVFTYDSYGRLLREALKTPPGTTIDPATDYDVKEYESAFQIGAPGHDSHWYSYEGVKIWPHAGANASTARYASRTYTQVSGLTSSLVAHGVAFDFDGNKTETTQTLTRGSAVLESSTAITGSTQSMVQKSVNGYPVTFSNAQGHLMIQSYDGLGRLQATDDPRIGTTTYDYLPDSLLVGWVTTPDWETTASTYDAAGRVNSQTNADGKTAYFRYDAAGNLTHQWGDTVNPVKYAYNELGQKTEMHTYRSGTWTGSVLPSGFSADGDKTTWSYQTSTGLLLSKTDAANKTTTFEYTDLGQVKKRTDARGWITNYLYNDPRKLLSKVDYTDGVTTDVDYTYDRAGRSATVTDAAGLRTFSYYDTGTTSGTLDASARLKSETLPSFLGGHVVTYTYQYGVAGRANGAVSSLKLGTGSLYTVTYAYDDVLRLNGVTYNTTTPYTYTYEANSNLIDRVTQGTGSSGYGYRRDYTYEEHSNRLEKMTHEWDNVASRRIETRLTYDLLGRRNTEKTRGSDYLSLLGRGSHPGVHVDYGYNDRSEVTDSAKYVLPANWTLPSNPTLVPATIRDYAYDVIGNRTSDQDGSYGRNSLNQYTSAPGFGGTITYDENGNLTHDGVRSFSYDAENRLISVTQGGSTWNYKYDYLGRRIEKSGTGIATTRFVYDGWNLIAELDGSGTIVRRFAWGLDVSGSLQGAGGIGGLLVVDDGVSRRYPAYDASHNVIALYKTDGSLGAAYEYDPFGNQQTAAGPSAAANPFRSATKYADAETQFVYYGHRYYVPILGRFLNRDPIEEEGGINLYGFCGNDGVNYYDYLGLDSQSDNKSFAEEAERAAREAAMDRARGEIIAKYGITGLAFGEGGSDRDVINAYVDGYNGFVDNFNASVQSRGGADGNFGKSPFGGVSEVGSAELRANGAVANGAAVGLTQEQRNLAKTATVTLGDLVSLGTVGDDAISARTPSSRRGIDYNSISADAYGRAWDLNRGSGADPWGAVVGGFGQYSNALNTGALLEIAAPIAAVAPVAIVEFVVPTAIVVAKNIHIDGPKLKPNPLHGGVPTGRVAQVRVGTTPVFRIDYTDLPDYKASPILHAHIWPIMSRHIPLQRKKGP
jgi:RHS repeat-associated core domain